MKLTQRSIVALGTAGCFVLLAAVAIAAEQTRPAKPGDIVPFQVENEVKPGGGGSSLLWSVDGVPVMPADKGKNGKIRDDLYPQPKELCVRYEGQWHQAVKVEFTVGYLDDLTTVRITAEDGSPRKVTWTNDPNNYKKCDHTKEKLFKKCKGEGLPLNFLEGALEMGRMKAILKRDPTTTVYLDDPNAHAVRFPKEPVCP